MLYSKFEQIQMKIEIFFYKDEDRDYNMLI